MELVLLVLAAFLYALYPQEARIGLSLFIVGFLALLFAKWDMHAREARHHSKSR